MSKEVNFKKGVREFQIGSGLAREPGGGARDIPIGYEKMCRYTVPPEAQNLTVSVQYFFGDIGAASFRAYFRKSPEEIGLPQEFAEGSVMIKLKD